MAQQSYIKSLFSKFASAGKKSLSVELYSHLPYDVEAFYKINPSFCSITWAHGDLSNFAGLSTITLCKKLYQNSIPVIMHVGGKKFSQLEALTTFQKMKDMGVKNILAIRGGPILKTDNPDCDFPYGLEFLQFLRKEFGTYFNIGTTGYPIGHPSAADPIKDIDYLKKKVDAGADFIMCQGVFDLQTFKDFYKRCREQEINVPILPGVYAINSYQVLQNLKNFCKIMPEEYEKTMEKLQNDADAISDYSVNYVSDLIRSLLKDEEISIPGVHVYCYNNLTLVSKIFEKLDLEDLKIYQPKE